MKQPLIIISFLVILGLGFGYMFVWPNYQRWSGKRAELKSITTELDDLAKKQSFIKELEGAEPTLTQMSDLALTFIPVEEEREQFASELDGLAQSIGLTLTTLTFSTDTTAKPKAAEPDDSAAAATSPAANAAPAAAGTASPSSTTLNFNASLAGSYSQVELFLKQLELMKRYATVRTFEVTTTAPVGAAPVAAASPDPTATPTPAAQQINLTISGSIFTKSLNKNFAPDQKFSPTIWQFLLDRTATTPEASANNPFAIY
jgi:hypothetical protein